MLRKRVLERALAGAVAPGPQERQGRTRRGRALAVLDALPDGASPFLVFGAKGTKLRVQATNLKETVGAIDGLPGPRRGGASWPGCGWCRWPTTPTTRARTTRKGERRGAIGEKAVQLALKYLGIPYVWGGATPAGGFDCSGLVMYVYGKLGMRLHHFTGPAVARGHAHRRERC